MQSDIGALPHAPRLAPIGVFERYLLSPESYERLRASGFSVRSDAAACGVRWETNEITKTTKG